MTRERYNKIFNAFILVGTTLAVTVMTVLKFQDPQVSRSLLLFSAFGSLMGVMSAVLTANGYAITFLFGLLDVSIYGVICYLNHIYGTAILHFVYFVPMQFVGYFQWRRMGSSAVTQIHPRCLGRKGQWGVAGVLLVAVVVVYLVLCRFNDTPSGSFIKYAVLFDAVAVCCNVLGQLFMSGGYMEQWALWIGVNVASLVMWGMKLGTDGGAASVYVIKYSFYLLNTIHGFRIWSDLYNRSKYLEE